MSATQYLPRKSITAMSACLLAATAALGLSAPVMANDGTARTEQSVLVYFSDLDLTTTQGATQLEGRIKRASRDVCRPLPTKSIKDQMDYRSCVTDANTDGQRAMVTLIAQAKSGEKFAADARIQVGN